MREVAREVAVEVAVVVIVTFTQQLGCYMLWTVEVVVTRAAGAGGGSGSRSVIDVKHCIQLKLSII